MNALNILHRSREIGRIAAGAGRRSLTREEISDLNAAIDQINYERTQESNPDPSLWPLNSERRRMADGYALRTYLKTGSLPDQLRPLMLSATQGTSNAAGGYTIPATVMQEITHSLKFSGGMYAAARHVVTAQGSSFPWPYINDTEKAYKIAESMDVETSAQAVTFGSVDLEKAQKYTSGLIRVPNELLQDSDLFLPAIIETLRDRIFRGTNPDLTTGGGSTEANGILTAAALGVTAASAITSDNIADLIFSISAFYRNQPTSVFMMHSTTLKHLMKQKSGDNLVFPSLWIDGSLLNYPVIENDDFPVFAAGAKVIAFGDFNRYIIRSTPLRIKRLVERHAHADQSSFAAILRVDGDLVDPNAVKYLRTPGT